MRKVLLAILALGITVLALGCAEFFEDYSYQPLSPTSSGGSY